MEAAAAAATTAPAEPAGAGQAGRTTFDQRIPPTSPGHDWWDPAAFSLTPARADLVLRVGMPVSEARAILDGAGGQDVSSNIGRVRIWWDDDGPPPAGVDLWYVLPDKTGLHLYADEGEPGSGAPLLVREIIVGRPGDGVRKFVWERGARRVDAVELSPPRGDDGGGR